MPIKVWEEPAEMTRAFGVKELCCFCYKPTTFWYRKKDVAVCDVCAEFSEPADVPSKKVWCEAVAAREPASRM